ncbi:hypothetical protein [Amycolatopsis sp. 195334CR]|uniref:hypothetical protein n=1 Tax=Amycolatopsis sp. 195334CR TaxID=2814588 RepID=UPI001A8D8E14|nr:hypothetical protein [Amycolatopsis sp. 195334CR]MBN6040054.1 hypothetical protein [Amycolatopsis sp. 195334CR]
MPTSRFAQRPLDEQYLIRRIAARERVDVASLAALPTPVLDRLMPGVRAWFARRAHVAAQLLARRPVDPTAPEYLFARAHARRILARVDEASVGGAE